MSVLCLLFDVLLATLCPFKLPLGVIEFEICEMNTVYIQTKACQYMLLLFKHSSLRPFSQNGNKDV